MDGLGLDHQRLPGLQVQAQADQELGILFKLFVAICHRDALSAQVLKRRRDFLSMCQLDRPAPVVPQESGVAALDCELLEAPVNLTSFTRLNRISCG